MDIQEIREYCLSLPCTSEDMAFGPELLLLRVHGRIFACLGIDRPDYFVLNCQPDYALDLRDSHEEITPAWHWNKKYWNQLSLRGNLTGELIRSLIRHSYSEVVKKLPKALRLQNPEVLDVK